MKLKNEDLIEIGKMIDDDISVSKIASQFNINVSSTRRIISRYRQHGIEGILHRTKSYSFSPDFKLEIINRYYAGESKNSLAIEINVSYMVVFSWIKKYEQLGYNGLINKRGSPGMSKRGRTKTNEAKETVASVPLTDLEREELNELRNKRLEMELEATKKLQALVQKRIKRQTRKK